MIDFKVEGLDFLKRLPEVNERALEIAIDATVKEDVKGGIYQEMVKVFDNPTRYTLNSLQMTPTRNHNMIAYVWFKDPDRMESHYLLPQIEGGSRKTKGFERALDNTYFIPGRGARMNKHGNLSIGQVRQLLSVFGKAERTAGYAANITARSSVRNKKQRDYVRILGSNKAGLLPGVYQRKAKGSRGKSTGTHRAGQRGRRKSVVRARGLVPILLDGRQPAVYREKLNFYSISERLFYSNIRARYINALNKLI